MSYDTSDELVERNAFHFVAIRSLVTFQRSDTNFLQNLKYHPYTIPPKLSAATG